MSGSTACVEQGDFENKYTENKVGTSSVDEHVTRSSQELSPVFPLGAMAQCSQIQCL